MAARLSGQHGDLGKKDVVIGNERGAPIHPYDPSTSSPSGPEREMDGALGVSGGQPDVSPSGPDSNIDTPEPKVKHIF